MPAACSLSVQALDAEGVDDDVLRRRRGRDQERARARPSHGDTRRIGEREHDDRGDQQKLREHQPAAPPPEQGATAPARRAHRPPAPTGTSACRACRPARTGRWCRDRRRPRASTPAASSPTAPAAARRRSRGTSRSARAAADRPRARRRTRAARSERADFAVIGKECSNSPGRTRRLCAIRRLRCAGPAAASGGMRIVELPGSPCRIRRSDARARF